MIIRRSHFTLAAALAFAGCGRPAPNSAPAPAPVHAASLSPLATPADTLASVHWIGETQIAADTNSAALMDIWNLPASRNVLSQTLDRLSSCPWPLLHRRADTNAAALLRPLLDDLVRQEFYFFAADTAMHHGAMVLCVRLPDDRAARWETSLAAVLKSLTGIPPSRNSRGWTLQKHEIPSQIELRRAGPWTLVGAADDHNDLLDEIASRIRGGSNPFPSSGTNFWLDADLDLPHFARAFALSWQLPADFPRFHVSAIGEGTNIHSRAQCTFAHPLPMQLEPWNFPTNLIHAPVASLTLCRGFKSWLDASPLWNKLQAGPAPDQLYVWADLGPPSLTFFAAPLTDASNRVSEITDLVLQKAGAAYPTNEDFGFRRKEGGGLEWAGLPFLNPNLTFAPGPQGGFVTAGLFLAGTSDQPPPAIPEQTMANSNLVWYSWEMSGWRDDAWLYIGQFWRYVFHHAQLPFQSRSLLWLKALSPKLGRCVTEVSLTAPNQLTLDRKSTLGFSGLELHLLADWLESPRFPIGFHTLVAPPDPAAK